MKLSTIQFKEANKTRRKIIDLLLILDSFRFDSRDNDDGINKILYKLEEMTIIDAREQIKSRLAYLRQEIEAERISYGEIAELQSLKQHIDPSDTLLLEWAGVDKN